MVKKNFYLGGLLAIALVFGMMVIGCEDGNTDSNTPQVVAKPVATPAGGNYTSAQSVTLTSATTGADIHYTLDGTTPTTSSTQYSSAITIGETKTLKAFAVKSGMTDSDILTATYTITPTFTVTYHADGGTPAPTSPATVASGSTITQPPAMTKLQHGFGGWFTDSTFSTPAVFPITVTADVNLYAKWIFTLGSVEELSSHLASLPSNTVDNPINLTVNINLGTMPDAGSGWRQLLDTIDTADKFVNLDLSFCTMTGTSFNPYFYASYQVTAGKDKIVSLVLPDAATSIEGNESGSSYAAFDKFNNLTAVSGANITTIGDNVFDSQLNDFDKLQSVDFPKATSIGEGAFMYNINLESISLPQVTNIGDYAFSHCTKLESVDFPLATNIGNSAFSNCTKLELESVDFPLVTNIGRSAFSECKSLQSVSLPQATSIGEAAFGFCTGLQSVNLPKVTSIGHSAFRGTGATALTITMGRDAPTLGARIFYYVEEAKTVTVKVPAGATGYTPFSGTVSGNNTNSNWANGLRGAGWDGNVFLENNFFNGGGAGDINASITVIIQQ